MSYANVFKQRGNLLWSNTISCEFDGDKGRTVRTARATSWSYWFDVVSSRVMNHAVWIQTAENLISWVTEHLGFLHLCSHLSWFGIIFYREMLYSMVTVLELLWHLWMLRLLSNFFPVFVLRLCPSTIRTWNVFNLNWQNAAWVATEFRCVEHICGILQGCHSNNYSTNI
jgi:hypothetical protein